MLDTKSSHPAPIELLRLHGTGIVVVEKLDRVLAIAECNPRGDVDQGPVDDKPAAHSRTSQKVAIDADDPERKTSAAKGFGPIAVEPVEISLEPEEAVAVLDVVADPPAENDAFLDEVEAAANEIAGVAIDAGGAGVADA